MAPPWLVSFLLVMSHSREKHPTHYSTEKTCKTATHDAFVCHLNNEAECVLSGDKVTVFHLNQAPAADSTSGRVSWWAEAASASAYLCWPEVAQKSTLRRTWQYVIFPGPHTSIQAETHAIEVISFGAATPDCFSLSVSGLHDITFDNDSYCFSHIWWMRLSQSQSRHTLLVTAFFWQGNQPILMLRWADALIFSSCCNSRSPHEPWVIPHQARTLFHLLSPSPSLSRSFSLLGTLINSLSLDLFWLSAAVSFPCSLRRAPSLAAPHTFSLIFFPFASLTAPTQ